MITIGKVLIAVGISVLLTYAIDYGCSYIGHPLPLAIRIGIDVGSYLLIVFWMRQNLSPEFGRF